MKGTPKITILLATYERAHLIEDTLDSIIAQTYTNWECIIIDDSSEDETRKVVERIIKKDSRFHYYLKAKNYKKGLSGTRNYGLDIAKERGDKYIQFFDDDDIMHPRKLELQIVPFLRDPDIDVVLCKYEGFTSDENPLTKKAYSEIPIKTSNLAEDFLFNKIRINSAGPLFKLKLFKEERFDESLAYGEERELFLRIFFKNKPKHYSVEEYLFFYRHHPVSITARKDNQIEKIGVNVITHQKIWDYLYEQKLLNTKVVSYFLRQFLLQNHNKSYIEKIKLFLSEKELSSFQDQKFKLIIFLHLVYIRIIHKLMFI